MQVDQLVSELLARGDINDDLTLELNRMLADWRAGTIDPDDVTYLEALHTRLTQSTAEPVEEVITPSPAPLSRLDGLSVDEWRDRALKAEAELAQIQDAALNG